MNGKANLAAPVAARLLNRARETGDDHQTLLTSYCIDRFLYRLGVFVRSGPGTVTLSAESAREYIRTRFGPLATPSDAERPPDER